jgi:hypothetical protein
MFRKKGKIASILLCVCFIACLFSACDAKSEAPDYSKAECWAFLETDTTDTKADVFFVAPTVYAGGDNERNMPLSDKPAKESFVGATNMEKGIYDEESRFFAPYYRQADLVAYEMEADEREEYLAFAYVDVKAAFEYYMENYNDDRPIILAGFSQGADMCLRLLKDCFADEKTNDLLVACYAIGWTITEEEMAAYPHLRFAEGEDDTGVIVAFNSESEDTDYSFVVPGGTKTLAINPLNWKTDSTVADKSENLGACFTDYDGNITEEIAALTGAYIDPVRGTLKVTDVAKSDYPGGVSFCPDGVYHVYDYQFFYRNLQKNVSVRLAAYLAK